MTDFIGATSRPDHVAIAAEQARDGIELVGFGDFSTKHPKLREPIIEGLLRRGETANIIASTKVGKSWMAADLGMAVATGTKWLKQFSTEAGKVVYIDLELHPETFAGRLRRIADFRDYDMESLNNSFYPICLRGTGKTILSLGSIVDALPSDVSMIVLDAWYRLLPGGMSENDNAAMMGLYNHLDAYAKQLDCAFVVIHHSSKGDQSGKRVTDVGSGAGSISRAADTHIVIRPHEEEGLAVVEAATRSFAPMQPLSIFFTFPCWHVSQTEAAVKQAKSATTAKNEKKRKEDAEIILKHFGDNRPFSITDANKAIGGNFNRTAAIVKDLASDEKIVLHSRFKRKRATELSDHYTTDTGHRFDESYGPSEFYGATTTATTTPTTTGL